MARTPVAPGSSASENENVVAVGDCSDFAPATSDNLLRRQVERTRCTMSIAELVGLGVVTGLGAGTACRTGRYRRRCRDRTCRILRAHFRRRAAERRSRIAVATSLASIVPASVVSFVKHLKSGHADLGFLRDWGPGIVLGVAAAQIVAPYLDGKVLETVFAGLCLLFAYRFAFPDRFAPVLDAPPGGFFRHCASLGDRRLFGDWPVLAVGF